MQSKPTHIHIQPHAHTHAHMHENTYIYTHTLTYTHKIIHANSHTCMHLCMYTHSHTCAISHVYMYVHIETNTFFLYLLMNSTLPHLSGVNDGAFKDFHFADLSHNPHTCSESTFSTEPSPKSNTVWLLRKSMMIFLKKI